MFPTSTRQQVSNVCWLSPHTKKANVITIMPTIKKLKARKAKLIRTECAKVGIKVDFVLSIKLAKALINQDEDAWCALGGKTNDHFDNCVDNDDCWDNYYYTYTYGGVSFD